MKLISTVSPRCSLLQHPQQRQHLYSVTSIRQQRDHSTTEIARSAQSPNSVPLYQSLLLRTHFHLTFQWSNSLPRSSREVHRLETRAWITLISSQRAQRPLLSRVDVAYLTSYWSMKMIRCISFKLMATLHCRLRPKFHWHRRQLASSHRRLLPSQNTVT
jgi:hypothetical protein